MICSDHIYRPIFYSVYQRFLICSMLDRRIHLKSAIIFCFFCCDHQVMRRCLTSHIESFCLGFSYYFHRLFSGYVAGMIAASRFSDQLHISFKLLPLAFGAFLRISLVFAVSHYHFIQRLCTHHSLFHDVISCHSAAVIGESYNVWSKLFYIGQLFPLFILGYRTVRINSHLCVFFYCL